MDVGHDVAVRLAASWNWVVARLGGKKRRRDDGGARIAGSGR